MNCWDRPDGERNRLLGRAFAKGWACGHDAGCRSAVLGVSQLRRSVAWHSLTRRLPRCTCWTQRASYGRPRRSACPAPGTGLRSNTPRPTGRLSSMPLLLVVRSGSDLGNRSCEPRAIRRGRRPTSPWVCCRSDRTVDGWAVWWSWTNGAAASIACGAASWSCMPGSSRRGSRRPTRGRPARPPAPRGRGLYYFRNSVTRSHLVVHAAALYSLISPPRTGIRRVRPARTGNGVTFGSSSGARRLSPAP